MADTVILRSGPEATAPVLTERELAITADTGKVLVGSSGGNKVVGSVDAAAGRFPRVTILEQTAAANAAPGMIFEDTDGRLKYKNLEGAVTTL